MMLWCFVYRSTKKENCYLYVEHENDFSMVPENILSIFGKPHMVMKILLESKRQLVAGSADEIKKRISKEGFFLQMFNEDDFKI